MPCAPTSARGIRNYLWDFSIRRRVVHRPTYVVHRRELRIHRTRWSSLSRPLLVATVACRATGSRRARRDLVPRSRGLLDLVSLTQRARSSRAAARLSSLEIGEGPS